MLTVQFDHGALSSLAEQLLTEVLSPLISVVCSLKDVRNCHNFGLSLTELSCLFIVGHTSGVRSVAILSDGATFVSGSFDKSARLWILEDLGRVSYPLTKYLNHFALTKLSKP